MSTLSATKRSANAYIALGANLGDRSANIHRALNLLRKFPGVQVLKVSSLLENPAVGGPAGAPDFLNAAAHLETTLPPRALLQVLLDVEASLGRVRTERWGPRLIDLDLLLYDGLMIHEDGLTLPHPRLCERRFVLIPLAEIAPNVIHPALGRTIADLCKSAG